MNQTNRLTGAIGFVFCGALFGALSGCTTYVQQPPPREVYVPPPPVYVPPPTVVQAPPPTVYAPPAVEMSFVIRSENDFYEPLTPYGRWEAIPGHGRCWIPARVANNWRPYSDGYWQRTDAGWYWASDEPWAWATYHYGRWDFSSQLGWYWVPQTQWAPAWVSWHRGGGYVGWAPLQPSARIGGSGVVGVNVRLIEPRAFVFVEERRFLQPVRPTTVVNNTTIINKTVNITNIKVVNNTVINEGPQTTVIEQVSGQKVQAVPVRELRRKQEAAVVARKRSATPIVESKTQSPAPSRDGLGTARPQPDLSRTNNRRDEPSPARPERVLEPAPIRPPVRGEATARQPQTIPALEPLPAEKPAVVTQEPVRPTPVRPGLARGRDKTIPRPADAKTEVTAQPEAARGTNPETKTIPALEPLPAEKPAVVTEEPVRPTPVRPGVARGRDKMVPRNADVNAAVKPGQPEPARETKTGPALEGRPLEKSAAITNEAIAPAPAKKQPVERARGKPIPTPAAAKTELKREAKPEVKGAIHDETKPSVAHGAERLVKGKQDGNGKQRGTNTVDKARKKKTDEAPTPPEQPGVPP